MRQLPAVRVLLSHPCAENCKKRQLPCGKTPTGTSDTVKEIYRQAGTGGVLLSSMGNPQPFPVYWDRLLINASQVTNPPIDPLREPMETRVFLGKKPAASGGDADGHG